MPSSATSDKTVLIAHGLAAVRDRFAVSLGDANHRVITADAESAATAIAADPSRGINLALVDLGLAVDGALFAKTLKHATSISLPIVVFAGSVRSAAEVPALSALNVGYVNEHAPSPQILPALSPYLFPDSFNRRASVRVAVGVPISYRAGQTITGSVTLDVAKGGLAIRTLNPLSKGTPVQVKFRLPGAPDEIEAAGRIAWSDRKVGMGVQFDEVSPDDQRAIDTFVEGNG